MLRSSAALLLGALSLTATAQSSPMPTFMVGCWTGEHAGSPRYSYEVWMGPKAARMLGISQTVLRAAPSSSFCELSASKQTSSNTLLNVRTPPTRFRMSDASATHAEFANPEHDFPQRIRYSREGDLLRAELSGGSPVRRIEFRFRKVGCETLTQ